MGDEDYELLGGGTLFMSVGVGESRCLEYVGEDGISMSSDMPDQEWQDSLIRALNQPATEMIMFTVPWWQVNTAQRLLLGRVVCGYSVPRLRRGGKSHRGKQWMIGL